MTPHSSCLSQPNIAPDSGQLHEHIRVLDPEVVYSCASRACVLDALRHKPRLLHDHSVSTDYVHNAQKLLIEITLFKTSCDSMLLVKL